MLLTPFIAKNCTNFCIALMSFFFTLLYIVAGAFPQFYTRPEWHFGAYYTQTLTVPGFAIVGGDYDAAMANMIGGHSCTFPSNDTTCNSAWQFSPSELTLDHPSNDTRYYSAWPSSPSELTPEHYGELEILQFNAMGSSFVFNESWYELSLQTIVNCKLFSWLCSHRSQCR